MGWHPHRRPNTIVDPGGTQTSLVHSELGELIRRDRAVANGPFEETIYDSLGRPAEIRDRMGRSRAFTYDPNTNRLLSDVGDEGEVFYDYDALGRITWAQRVSPLDTDTDFQLATGFNRSASVEHAFTYDQLGRVHTEDVTIAGIAFPTIQRDHVLFSDRREVTTTLPYRHDMGVFDGRGRLESLVSDALPETVEFDWMGDIYSGRVQGKGPFSEIRKFNDFGELEAHAFLGATSQSMGEPAFVSDYCQGRSTCSDTLLEAKYIRDDAGRLMERAFSYTFPTPVPRATPSFNNQQFQYDTRGHLINFVEERNSLDLKSGPVSTFEIDYKRGVHGSVTAWDTTFNTQNFVHDASRTADGRATAFHLDFGGGVTEPVKYDRRGFVAELGGFSFEYDQWQQLTSVHRKGLKYAESYLYDFAGRLVATINRNNSSGSTIDLLVLDGEKVVEQWRGAASQSTGGDQLELRGEYFWGPLQQQMIAARTVDSNFDLVFTLTDALQSIIGVWNEDELRISEYAEYDPEGRISARAPDDTEDCSERNLAETPCHIRRLRHFGFTGAFRSTTTGLYRFGARWYSPRFGQFMSPDPLWYVDSFDVYGYAAFDPVNRWDPSGMASEGMGDITSDSDQVWSLNSYSSGRENRQGSTSIGDKVISKMRRDKVRPGAGNYFELSNLCLTSDNRCLQQDGELVEDWLTPNSVEEIRERIARIARSQIGSKKWLQNAGRGCIGRGRFKCNIFVHEVLEAAGADPGIPTLVNPRESLIPFISPQYGPHTAGDWADPNVDVDGWRVLEDGESPAPGDVVATLVDGGGGAYSGHVAIVVSEGTSVGASSSQGGAITETSFGFGADDKGEVVFRRFVGGGD
ncbi:hypothetical protein DV096_14260 [Bradymonadaceae bacterium TMQ3]|nr:hypothetical protein DV096_14260 [Bradymonadaceae bacterium TMQ3]